MSRGLSADVLAALASETIRGAWLADIAFSGRTLYLWTGVGNMVWNGHTYTGVGALGGLSPISESIDGRVSGITLHLAGIDAEHLTACLDEVENALRAYVRFACFDTDGAMIGTPVLVGAGRVDSPVITDSGEKIAIALNLEHELADLERPRLSRYTDEDQQSRFPGDKAFEFVAGVAQKPGQWGEVEMPEYKRGTKGDLVL